MSPSTEATPLTAEDEADLRAYLPSMTLDRAGIEVPRLLATLTRERAEHAALRETARDAVRQAHGLMHYGSLEECGAGICVKRRAALDEVKDRACWDMDGDHAASCRCRQGGEVVHRLDALDEVKG